LQVDGELELGRLQHWQVGGLGAFEDLAGIDAARALGIAVPPGLLSIADEVID
jgi:hypothetical protein